MLGCKSYMHDHRCEDYTVKKGDTLYSISKEYNVPLALLIRVNPYVDIYNLQIGDELCIPTVMPMVDGLLDTYTVGAGESLDDVLNHTGMNISELLQFNNLSNIMLLEDSTLVVPRYDTVM